MSCRALRADCEKHRLGIQLAEEVFLGFRARDIEHRERGISGLGKGALMDLHELSTVLLCGLCALFPEVFRSRDLVLPGGNLYHFRKRATRTSYTVTPVFCKHLPV